MRRSGYALVALLVVVLAAAALVAVQLTGEDGASVEAPPPTAAGYFRQLPPGAELPSEQECAGRVRTSQWEPRPENYEANHARPQNLELADHPDFDEEWNAGYKTRITGNYVGTTDEIIQWAACKWGLSDELLRAQATAESEWEQSAEGDDEPRERGNCTEGDTRDPCPTSFGLLQNKWYFNTAGYPWFRTMTPFHLDWSGAKLRGCYDGRQGDLPAGDMTGCLGNWFSGGWHDEAGREYVGRVQRHLENRTWLEWDDRSDEVAYTPHRAVRR